jgi:cell wall-associated NlpC family hydrolase
VGRRETRFGPVDLEASASAGVKLPRTSRKQWYAGQHVARDQLEPGDLVFYARDLSDPRSIHHVGIYVSNGHMIDAPHAGAVIRFDSVDEPDYIGGVRPSPEVPPRRRTRPEPETP